jgi:hypothetical protein
MTRYVLLSDSCGFVDVGHSLWGEDGPVVNNSCWPWPVQSFSCPSPLGLATVFYCLRLETSLFVASYDLQGYGGGIWLHLHMGNSGFPSIHINLSPFTHSAESDSYVMTDSQLASLSWNKAPIWGLRPNLYYCLTVSGLLIWDALSDERTGLLFIIVTGPRHRSHFRVRVL